MGKDVIIACDFSSKKETMAFLEKFGQRRPYVKIGMELYYAEGPAIVRELKERGHKVFLDLKLHDIPNTVKKAMRVLSEDMEKVVGHYAYNTKLAGLDGVVCSPLEAEKVHGICGDDFLTVTPGVRFADDAKGDQSRVTTPAKAKELGSDYIVVGRSITGAPDPLAAYERCVSEFL